MDNKSILVTLLIAAFFLACGANKKGELTKRQSQSYYLKMEKTPCFGTCPVYTVEIVGDGTTSMLGKRNVKQIGSFSGKLSDSTFAAIVKRTLEMDWSSYKEEYLTGSSDLPSTRFTFSLKPGDTAMVRMEADIAPIQIQQLAEVLEDYRKSATWTSTILD